MYVSFIAYYYYQYYSVIIIYISIIIIIIIIIIIVIFIIHLCYSKKIIDPLTQPLHESSHNVSLPGRRAA